MTCSAHECDVLVIGAGPAGAAAAQLLASWGRSVIVAHRAVTTPSLAESLPPSVRKLLRLVGQLDEVEAAGFFPNDGNIADWAGAARVTTSATPGFHVGRAAFDDVLRRTACKAGVRIVDATVRGVAGDDPVCATLAASDGTITTIRARQVLDCSGRAGVLARRGLRRHDTRYRTLALVAEWESDGWADAERTHTTVESYPDGWAWSVPLSNTRRQCTVMVDPSTPAAHPPAQDRYAAEVAKTGAMKTRLAGARQTSAVWACDASLYDAVRAADGAVLLVGDAASFIEPLSSAGVKKALLSAWRAAVVTNTCLKNAAMAGVARDLYVSRERQVFADCLRRSHAFFQETAVAYDTPYWLARAELCETADTAGESADDSLDDRALAGDRDVREALERLRRSPGVRLRSSDALRFEPAPSIEGREVVMRDALRIPGWRSPLQYAAGVNLPALARLAHEGREVPALIAAYQHGVAAVPMAGVLAGLSLLVARHALVEDSAS